MALTIISLSNSVNLILKPYLRLLTIYLNNNLLDTLDEKSIKDSGIDSKNKLICSSCESYILENVELVSINLSLINNLDSIIN